jgi:hypothetical protein
MNQAKDLARDRPENEKGVTIEVTAEMVRAGVEAYLECDREYDPDAQIVTQVFEAMWKARPPPKSAGASDLR